MFIALNIEGDISVEDGIMLDGVSASEIELEGCEEGPLP